jgi:hypothetical protein
MSDPPPEHIGCGEGFSDEKEAEQNGEHWFEGVDDDRL